MAARFPKSMCPQSIHSRSTRLRGASRAAAVLTAMTAVALFAGGCGNATANTALALVGVGVGAQALTGTDVEVTVDIYDPGKDGDFKLGHGLAIQQVVKAPPGAVDPVKRPTAAVL